MNYVIPCLASSCLLKSSILLKFSLKMENLTVLCSSVSYFLLKVNLNFLKAAYMSYSCMLENLAKAQATNKAMMMTLFIYSFLDIN